MMADIPGIIEGAHEGKGLGIQFLQHVERTRILAYLIPLEDPDPQANFDRLRREVSLYSTRLSERPYLVVLSKRDLLAADDPVPQLSAPGALDVVTISSAAGVGLEDLKELLWRVVQDVRIAEQVPIEGPGTNGKNDDDTWELDWGETDSGVD